MHTPSPPSPPSGVLLGSVSGGVVEVTNSFGVYHKKKKREEAMEEVLVRRSAVNDLLVLYKQANDKEVVVGWYSSYPKGEDGQAIGDFTLAVHSFFTEIPSVRVGGVRVCAARRRARLSRLLAPSLHVWPACVRVCAARPGGRGCPACLRSPSIHPPTPQPLHSRRAWCTSLSTSASHRGRSSPSPPTPRRPTTSSAPPSSPSSSCAPASLRARRSAWQLTP